MSIVGEIDLETLPGTNDYVFELGKRQFFTLITTVNNEHDPAYLPNLYVSHDEAIDLSPRESDVSFLYSLEHEIRII